MAAFVRVTQQNPQAEIILNMDRIETVWPEGDGCRVDLAGGPSYYLHESPEQLMEAMTRPREVKLG